MLCSCSAFFKSRCNCSKDERSYQVELKDDHPAAFELFLDWLYFGTWSAKVPKKWAGSHSTDSREWIRFATEAYILSERIESVRFQNYSLAMVIRHVHEYDAFDMKFIVEHTTEASPLRLFCTNWMRFRLIFDPNFLRSPECRQAQEALRSTSAFRMSFDPREIEIRHWSSACSVGRRVCAHTPASWLWKKEFYSTNKFSSLSKVKRITHKWEERPSQWRFL